MSLSAKPDDPRPPRRRCQPVSRGGNQHRPERWIGTGNRRSQKPEAASAVTSAKIIYLSWADTFGRPARGLLPGTTAHVLPFRGR
ncbi:hypothetical protein [Methylobacterium sp. NEAU K]|uniref:hypothetical protein n=1 Tax=Methylobacterium sp. NEAU K TaxID=3064946 RepID=UPI002732952E|nr:hypothetical protein [Methylobacterium sp. NEAU K]MDP4003840.1 hypothetical protein [Methylobacterium sp. NEAU K]